MFGLVSSLMRPAGLIRQGPVWLVTLGLLVALAACSMVAPAAETGLGSADAIGTEAARVDAEEPEDVVTGDRPQPESLSPMATVAIGPPDVATSPPPSARDISTATPAPTQDIATPTPVAGPGDAQDRPTDSPATSPSTAVTVLQLPNVADTVERVRPAVVSLVTEVVLRDRFGMVRRDFGSGTGVIISEDGLVITNNHVIEGAAKIIVTMDDGSQVEAEMVGADRLSDLAILRIPGIYDTFLPLNDDVHLRVGEWVIAIGNALALPGGPTVTVGVVSAMGRTIGGNDGTPLYDLIQTDTSINPGNSGGPLLSLNGDLVGINTAMLRGGDFGGPHFEGIGFAINMETTIDVSGQLIKDGKVEWAWMGVFLADLTPDMAAQFGLPIREGVIIQDVLQGGPSDKAGIRPGDIVTSINGKEVATVLDLMRMLRQDLEAHQEVEVQLFRNGGRDTITMVMGERPTR
jgi:serine protease Do